jgi:WD40 repeat protein
MFEIHGASVCDLAHSPAMPNLLFACGSAGTVVKINLKEKKITKLEGLSGWVYSVAISPKEAVLFAGGEGKKVLSFNLTRNTHSLLLETESAITKLKPRGDTLIISSTGVLTSFGVSDGRAETMLNVHGVVIAADSRGLKEISLSIAHLQATKRRLRRSGLNEVSPHC